MHNLEDLGFLWADFIKRILCSSLWRMLGGRSQIFVAQDGKPPLFIAWRPVSGARVTWRIKMVEIRVSDIDKSISRILLFSGHLWCETSESLKRIFPGDLINGGKKNSKKTRFTITGTSQFSEARQVVGEIFKGSVVTKDFSMRYSLW